MMPVKTALERAHDHSSQGFYHQDAVAWLSSRHAPSVVRYVIDSPNPFIVPSDNGLFGATMVQTGYGEHSGQSPRALDLQKPLGTLVGTQKHALVTAFITKFNTGATGSSMNEPLHTVVAGGKPKRSSTGNTQGMVVATLNQIDLDGVVDTEANLGKQRVSAFLMKYYGNMGEQDLLSPLHTVRTKDCFALVTVHGEIYEITDIHLRMLTPRELYRAQGFPETYRIDETLAGVALTKSAQVRMCGNSVCPPIACALVKANFQINDVVLKKAA